MAQYKILNGSSHEIYNDAVSYFRLEVRSGILYIDQALTPDGFDGAEDADWEYLVPFKSGHATAQGVFRYGVRDGAFVIDETLTVTGFSGSENTDWENIYWTKKP